MDTNSHIQKYDDSSTLCRQLKDNPVSYQYLSEECRSDPDLCRIAIQSLDSMLQYASAELRDSEAIADVVIDHSLKEYNPYVNCLSDRILSMDKYANRLIASNINYYCQLPEQMRANPAWAEAFLLNRGSLKYLPEAYRDDEHFVQLAVDQNGNALEYASPRLQNDFMTCLIAVNHTMPHYINWWISGGWSGDVLDSPLNFVSSEIKADPDFRRYLTEAYLKLGDCFSPELNICNDRERKKLAADPACIYDALDYAARVLSITMDETYTGPLLDLTEDIALIESLREAALDCPLDVDE